MRIGILEAGPAPDELARYGSHPAAFETLLAGRGLSFVTYSAYQGRLPEDPAECEGWLITGSKFGVYEDHAFIPKLEDLVRAAYAADIPVVGICFGHQLIAQALGGKVVKSDKGWGLGPMAYQSTETGGEISIMAVHQDQVVEKPEDAEVVASSEFCAYAGLAYKGKALSYQPHPEMTAPFVADLIRLRRGAVYPDSLSDAALARMDAPLDSDWMGARIAAFFLSSRT